MRTIHLEDWPRKDHYLFFKEFAYPHFSLCADMDISAFLPHIKQQGVSFTAAIMYLIARVANSIPEFRQRVREGDPVEYPVVHPSVTILRGDDLFTFCTVEYVEDFQEFIRKAEEEITRVKELPALTEKIQNDSKLYMSSIPWVSFTSFMHPLRLMPADSVPRFAWGKYQHRDGLVTMPLSVQGHHAVMDGLHAGIFYQRFQDLLDLPEWVGSLPGGNPDV
jgi:chloramphenicol O-acetyltransferase type A